MLYITFKHQRNYAPTIAVSVNLLLVLASLSLGEVPVSSDADTSPASYWKGNVHTHTWWSDGDDFPEMVADRYKKNGYHFLVISDHDVHPEGERWIDAETTYGGMIRLALERYRVRFGDRWVERRTRNGRPEVRLKPLSEYRLQLEEPDRFLLIPGEEISAKVHINALNNRDVILPIDGPSTQEIIRANVAAVADQRLRIGRAMTAVLNHPANFPAEEIAPVRELRLMEIYSRATGAMQNNNPEGLWDRVLAMRLGKLNLRMVYGVAVDDAHHYHERPHYQGIRSEALIIPQVAWVMVRSSHLSPESIIKALELGDFYSSNGVTLDDVQCDQTSITLTIHAEADVKYTTRFVASIVSSEATAPPDSQEGVESAAENHKLEIGKVVAQSDSLRPTYQFTGKELYVRAVVTSSKAHPKVPGEVEKAWTQPLQPKK